MVALWVLNYTYMYNTDMKGAFVHVWVEMGLLRAHVKLSRAHVNFLREHVIVITCPREVITWAREVITRARERYYVK